MISYENWLTIGRLVAPQGLHGEIRVQPFSDFPERFTKPGQRWVQSLEESPKEIQLISGRKLPGKSLFAVFFAGVNDRTQAKSLVGKKLLVPSNDRPQLAENEFHLLDLVGLEAKLAPEGTSLGKVVDLTSAGNDLLEIELLEGRHVLVPFVKAIVPEINLKEGWLILTPPPGLLEL